MIGVVVQHMRIGGFAILKDDLCLGRTCRSEMAIRGDDAQAGIDDKPGSCEPAGPLRVHAMGHGYVDGDDGLFEALNELLVDLRLRLSRPQQ